MYPLMFFDEEQIESLGMLLTSLPALPTWIFSGSRHPGLLRLRQERRARC